MTASWVKETWLKSSWWNHSSNPSKRAGMTERGKNLRCLILFIKFFQSRTRGSGQWVIPRHTHRKQTSLYPLHTTICTMPLRSPLGNVIVCTLFQFWRQSQKNRRGHICCEHGALGTAQLWLLGRKTQVCLELRSWERQTYTEQKQVIRWWHWASPKTECILLCDICVTLEGCAFVYASAKMGHSRREKCSRNT